MLRVYIDVVGGVFHVCNSSFLINVTETIEVLRLEILTKVSLYTFQFYEEMNVNAKIRLRKWR
jgi:hypothetical protein